MIFSAICSYGRPGLHIWRPGTNVRRYVAPVDETPDADGWFQFQCDLDMTSDADIQFKLYERKQDDSPSGKWEAAEHNRTVPRSAAGEHPERVWIVQNSVRVLLCNPMAASSDQVRIHLITAERYREGKLYVWSPDVEQARRIDPSGIGDAGPYWDVLLGGRDRHLFCFKFLATTNGGERFEPAYANRVYSSADGCEIWTHSEGLEIVSAEPEKKLLTVHLKQEGGDAVGARTQMRLWQESSDFSTDVSGKVLDDSVRFQLPVYTGIPYRFKFHNDELEERLRWEHRDATRTLTLDDDRDVWTLEGDRHVFDRQPVADQPVTISLAHRPPDNGMADELFAHVWVNQARWSILDRVAACPNDPTRFEFRTYPNVTTSLRFTDGQQWEATSRRTVYVGEDATETRRHVVLGRESTLKEPPAFVDLFEDPPFSITRPGVYQENDDLRFVLHAPGAARARVVGQWTGWEQNALEMRSTRSGDYWWATAPVAEIQSQLPAEFGGDYHGTKYKFLLDDEHWVQDPAAGWIDHSSLGSNSRLVSPSHFKWHDSGWRIPSWDYFIVYQIHPKRFTDRFPGDAPLVQVAKEISDSAGYLHDLGITAILLMPVNEVGSSNSWGYDPAYFYAVERDYGGPEALKFFVDTCHRHGLAVMLDVVFNHAGNDDNVLWHVARDSYFDGDTTWGAMINFDHPQCRHFFEQNLVYLQREFHVDGFRLDHTHTIVHSHQAGGFIRQPGSGGGWEFLHGLRHALHRDADSGAILIAEHLPNEWALTNYGGPMDSQWCDDFHDRLVDACKGHRVMFRLAAAMQLSVTHCQRWYNVTNYPESHDEVGNVNDRIANVAGYGRGLRLSKVAAAASLLSRGIPMFFMGAEVGEHRQFRFGSDEVLDLKGYQRGTHHRKVRAWWNSLCHTRRNPAIKGPAKLEVRYTDDQILAFSRGLGDDFYIVLNFGAWAGWRSLAEMNLPNRRYRELWNSSWPAFSVENENEHTNGGRRAQLHRGHWLHIPDYGVVVLERA